MDREESVCGDFAEPEFPNYDVMRESNTMYDSLNTNALLAANEVFDIHVRCCVRYPIMVAMRVLYDRVFVLFVIS